MLWVVQSNLYNEYGYEKLLTALQRLNVEHVIVKPVPFTNQLVEESFDSMVDSLETAAEPIIDTDKPIMVCGATTLNRVAKHKGWYPGTFLNDNFDFEVWRDGFGAENCLNGDAMTCKVKYATGDVFNDFFEGVDELFFRPTEDSKAFTGMVQDRENFAIWQKQVSQIEPEDEFLLLHEDTEIVIASAKKILAEYRFFVVDKKIVTGSMYKLGQRVISNEYVDERVTRFASSLVDGMGIERWQPAEAYVLDIAETPNGFKVVEINNLNSAGFYACDVFKIVDAIEQLTHRYQ